MSLSLDDKLLGEKVNNYCSSSEDEGDTDDYDKSGETAGQAGVETSNASAVSSAMSGLPQTGPKGVISDYRHYKALEQLRELDIQKKLVALAKQNTHACRSYREDVIDEIKDKKLSELLDTLDEDDEFLTQYRQNRMLELKNSLGRLPVYGNVLDLNSETFVHEIDSTDPGVTVLVLIYELGNEDCKRVIACFQDLCTEYSHIKFCKIRASDACLSYAFVSFFSFGCIGLAACLLSSLLPLLSIPSVLMKNGVANKLVFTDSSSNNVCHIFFRNLFKQSSVDLLQRTTQCK
ncbi:hypothetical protein AHF37_03238 [Paragonimus kellicotti]|nr:hypothetical protein AHF37_03238 [Paragonimus kellicotti]